MKNLLTVLLLALLTATPVAAQIQLLDGGPPRAPARMPVADEPVVLHVSDALNSTPEARAALDDFHRRKALGLLPSTAKHAHAVGDTLPFKVYNFGTSTPTNPVLDPIDFKLMVIDPSDPPRFQIWVELAELDNGHVTQADLDGLVTALADQTPDLSINPDAGIIVNDEDIFGEPPDVDGDGVTDVLMLDIRDGDLSPGVFLGGFVYSGDLTAGGNNRDVLYLDSNEALSSGLGLVVQNAAHEYQHLIHFNYDRNELTFVNEGLSEWAELANGYAGRRITYLDEARRFNVKFLRFFSNDDPRVLDDYQRAGLFTTYLAERLGPFEVGRLTRDSRDGVVGYNAILADHGLSMADVLPDFHAANFFNDAVLDPRYGYTLPQRLDVQATPLYVHDGRLATETPKTTATVNDGAAQYLVWDFVAGLSVAITVNGEASNLRGLALLSRGGVLETRTLNIGEDEFLFTGSYDKIAVVVAHAVPDGPRLTFDFSATWTAAQTYQLEEVVYDTGVVNTREEEGQVILEAFLFNPDTGDAQGSRQANRFDIPPGGILAGVAVAPYYRNDFQNQNLPPGAPRDFTLTIWPDDGSGRPGSDTLFSLAVEDPRSNLQGENNVLDFHTVDLGLFQSELAALPSPVYIGLTNAGDDENYLMMGVTPVAEPGENVAFLFLPSFGTWAAFPELNNANGDPILDGRVLPIRATFLIPTTPTSNEDPAEVPEAIALYPNFPNPFNPTTTLTYALPRRADVRLTIFDVLGREVAVLIEGVQPPGEHQVQLDARTWASGLYFYTLEAVGQRQTRRMLLIR